MDTTLLALVKRLDTLSETNIIPWSCPIPSFGDLSKSRIATLGLNPSNREFVDDLGNELDGPYRRFHTLKSLGLARWSEATTLHLQLITESCRAYFSRNPYDRWFNKLDHIISGTNASYYNGPVKACHLDLIPYATERKWTELTSFQRSSLLASVGDTLGLLLREAPVRLLILNGKTVVESLEKMAEVSFEKEAIPDWTLPRQSSGGVTGFAYRGAVRSLAGVKLRREVKVLGFNHNIQSSFGVTTQVTLAIRSWIARAAGAVI